MNGLISKIQRYATKDGPGLRSTVFAVGCPLRCDWCANPELMEAKPKFFFYPERCVGCGACAAFSNRDQRGAVCFYDAYEPVGYTISARELAAKLQRDQGFYDQSGGGVTYSGGEAALQSDFFLEVTRILKADSIHVALDTSGHVPWETLGPLVEAVDLVLYDIKVMDRKIHKRHTGADNQLILENAKRIAAMGKEMTVRLILVPGVNDDDKEIDNRLNFVRGLGNVAKVEILKYHRLGAGKYRRLGLVEPMGDTPECSDALAERVKQKAAQMMAIREKEENFTPVN